MLNLTDAELFRKLATQRQICHAAGLAWVDPRTGKAERPPKVKAKRKKPGKRKEKRT